MKNHPGLNQEALDCLLAAEANLYQMKQRFIAERYAVVCELNNTSPGTAAHDDLKAYRDTLWMMDCCLQTALESIQDVENKYWDFAEIYED